MIRKKGIGLIDSLVITTLVIFFAGGVISSIDQAVRSHSAKQHQSTNFSQQSSTSTTTTQVLNGHQLHSCKLPIKDNTDYSYCFFTANLSDGFSVKLTSAVDDNFTGANLSYPFIGSFHNCILKDVKLPTFDPEYMIQNHMSGYLDNYDFSGSVISGNTLSENGGKSVNFSGANLLNAQLIGTGFTQVIGTPKWLPYGWFVQSGFLIGPGAALVSDDLANINLSGRDLAGVIFDYSNLQGAYLSGANMVGATGTHIKGQPATLPPGWFLRNGTLTHG